MRPAPFSASSQEFLQQMWGPEDVQVLRGPDDIPSRWIGSCKARRDANNASLRKSGASREPTVSGLRAYILLRHLDIPFEA